MKKLTSFSVNFPVTIMMFVLAVFLLGYISFSKLGVDLFPDLNTPRIFVEIKAGERPPEEIEQQFVQNIESIAIRQKKVTQVSSISRVGSAYITVEYTWDADMDEAFLDLQKALTTASQSLDVDELNITQHDPNAVPVIVLALIHPEAEDMDELRRVAENYLRNELIRLEGIAEVELLGAEEKEVIVQTDAYLLDAYGLTTSDIANKISSYNRSVSGGSITEMGRKYIIKGVAEFQQLEDIGNVIVTYSQPTDLVGQVIPGERIPVFLSDVADISFRNKEPENIVHVNQKRCMALAIYKETKFNTINAVDILKKELGNLQKALPGFDLFIIQNQANFITSAVNEVKNTALIGVLLAVLILYVFLRRIGTTLIIALSIPISIIATFNLMYFNHLTLNIMTLGGLALGAGMLVDNAIVVMENIFRNLENGMPLKQAAIEGTAQISGAITSSTVTTIVVFLPIVYLHGSAGELFKEQAWTVAFALASSLVVAILVIPMLSSKFLKGVTPKKRESIQFPWYGRLLAQVLNRPWRIIIFGFFLIVIAVLLLPMVGSEFIPKTEANELTLNIKLPESTELYRTESTVRNMEDIIQGLLGDHIDMIYSVIGPSNTQTGDDDILADEHTASILLILNPERRLGTAQIVTALNEALSVVPDVEIQYLQEQSALQMTLGTDEAPIMVEVRGEELETLQTLTQQIKEKMLRIDDIFNIETSFDEGRTEVNITLDRIRAGLLNINIETIASELENVLSGRTAGEWEFEGEMQDITLRLPDISVSQLENLDFRSGSQKIRLDDVADIKKTVAPKEINRHNQVRVGIITAHIRSDKAFTKIIQKIDDELSDVVFPPDYRYKLTGEEQKRQEAFANLRFALILSIILVYMVMASQFESLVHPFTILLTIPMALTGTVFLFFLLGKTLNIMALIGIIMLAGIAVNDSIILVDAINQLKRDGMAVKEAIIEAGQRRIRPIIMTSLTTILALLPLTFGFGEGAALRAPMALAVIGGLLTSTLLTLIVIPSVYLKLDKLTSRT
ncbi:efflux RND transporter permease subunit [candidate division KSB1 bacterium]|nr:efflux RND transporter permease subunit [candidate division KSB1 bacterium]RQW04721.1 MAG: efflux RND transporter permease subunit [candidate division KSB1 bacterium]